MELLGRFLPAPPAVVLDVGGAAGAYALPLADQGYSGVAAAAEAKRACSSRCITSPRRPIATAP